MAPSESTLFKQRVRNNSLPAKTSKPVTSATVGEDEAPIVRSQTMGQVHSTPIAPGKFKILLFQLFFF